MAGLLLLGAMTLPFATGTVTQRSDEIEFTASDGATDDHLGTSVAISGDTLLAGAPLDDTADGIDAGSAYLYEPDDQDGFTEIKITASDGDADDRFGTTVAIDGNLILAGAPLDDNGNGPDAGAAYLYEPDGQGGLTETKITASDGDADDRFGTSVAISGDTLLVGSPLDDEVGNDAGSAYLYEPDGQGGLAETKVTSKAPAAGDEFGNSVALSGDTLLVGAHLDNSGGRHSGSILLFEPDGQGGFTKTKITASDSGKEDRLGSSVAIDGDVFLAGAPLDDNGHGTDAGSAYVYEPDGQGGFNETKVTASDGDAGDRFGTSVKIDGALLLAGAPLDDDARGTDAGSAYLYVPEEDGSFTESRLASSDGVGGDAFGDSVALGGEHLVAGAPFDDDAAGDAGSAYLFVAPPRNVSASPGPGINEITLTWDAAAGSSQGATYHVKRSTSSGGPYTEIATTTDLNYTDAGLSRDTYYYTVTVEDETGIESVLSNEASAQPPFPRNLTAREGDEAGEIDLAWEQPAGTSDSFTYRVYRSTETGSPYEFIDNTTDKSYTDEELEQDTYYYVVSAVDGQGRESALSDEASAEPRSEATSTPSSDPDPVDESQNDAGTGGDASDDPDDPTILAGGALIHINGTLIPGTDPVDAYGTRISPNATTSMRFNFSAPAGMALNLTLIAPDNTTVDTDQAPTEGGNVNVSVEAAAGEHLDAGVWVTVLEHRTLETLNPGKASPLSETAGNTSVNATGNATESMTPNLTFFGPVGFDYQDERECDPKC